MKTPWGSSRPKEYRPLEHFPTIPLGTACDEMLLPAITFTKLRTGKRLYFYPYNDFFPCVREFETDVWIYTTAVWLKCANAQGILNVLIGHYKQQENSDG
jgi:hypothetical protein